MAGLVASICLMATLFLGGCSLNPDDHDHPGLTSGKQLFNYHCADCHGEDGTGLLVQPSPANILTTKNQQGIVDYIKQRNGHRNMPVFVTMPDSEARKIATHLLDLKQHYETTPSNKKKPEGLMVKP